MEGSTFSDPFGNKKPMSQIGTGEGESPLAKPPVPPTDVRTFSSDLQSIRNTGGGEPTPYVPARPANVPASSVPQTPKPPVSTPPSGIAVGASPFSGGNTNPPMTPAKPVAAAPLPGMPEKKSGGKKIFVALVTFLVVVALGAVGYFFVYPLFAPSETPANTEPTTQTPALPESGTPADQTTTPATEIPTSTEPEATSTEPETSPVSDPFEGIQGIAAHASAFTVSPDATTETILSAPTLAALHDALPTGNVASPVFSEVVLKMPSGSVIPFATVAKFIAPTFFSDSLLASFSNDATYFTYAAGNGTWFGMAIPLKAGAPIGPVQDGMSALQADPDLANFFLENPGDKGVWADGNVHGKPTSQVSFSAPDATFSYTWFDRTLLISTNLTAAGEAAAKLGF